MKIHSTAIVGKNVVLGENVRVGPWCVIEDGVRIASGTILEGNVFIGRGTRIGKNNKIHRFATLGTAPQDLKYGGEATYLEIGDNNIIREYVNISRGTSETWMTKLGDNNLVMAYCHIAHDCYIGNAVILTNATNIAGHVHIKDFATIGGIVAVHQFTKIGEYAMVGAGSKIVKDIVPFALATGIPAKIKGMNIIGLKRRGFPKEEIEIIKKCFNILFRSSYNTHQAIEKIKAELPMDKNIKLIIDFIENEAKRGIAK